MEQKSAGLLDRLVRALPDFRGKRRLVRYLLRSYMATAKDLTIEGSMSCRYLLPNLKETIAFDLFCNGTYEPETFRFLSSLLDDDSVFLDLGANIGSVVIPLRQSRPRLRCICVEAAPWVFAYLEKNIVMNFPADRITLVNRALFNTSGQSLPMYSTPEHFGKGSLSPVFTQHPTMVTTVTVDDLLEELKLSHVDLIKIDIEGYELVAFQGARRLLERSDAPDIFFEFVDWAEAHAKQEKGAAQDYLLGKGYKLFRLDADGLLRPLSQVLRSGTEMLFASKKNAPGMRSPSKPDIDNE